MHLRILNLSTGIIERAPVGAASAPVIVARPDRYSRGVNPAHRLIVTGE